MFVQVPKELPPQLCLRLPHQVLSQAQRDQQEVGPGEEPGAAGPEVLHKAQRGNRCSRFSHFLICVIFQVASSMIKLAPYDGFTMESPGKLSFIYQILTIYTFYSMICI